MENCETDIENINDEEQKMKEVADTYREFAIACKKWIKINKSIDELMVQKIELCKKIKELEESKNKYDETMQKFLDLSGRDEYPIIGGSKILRTERKKAESFSTKTIPKYIEQLNYAILHEDLAFIAENLIPLKDTKDAKTADIVWSKVPTDPIEYLKKYREEPKFSAIVTALYASHSREVSVKPVLKFSEKKNRGHGA